MLGRRPGSVLQELAQLDLTNRQLRVEVSHTAEELARSQANVLRASGEDQPSAVLPHARSRTTYPCAQVARSSSPELRREIQAMKEQVGVITPSGFPPPSGRLP